MHHLNHLIYFSLLAQSAYSALLPRQNTTSTTTACNSSPLLCSRSYSSITHLGAHDSPFVKNSNPQSTTFTDATNQNVPTTTQLNAGVRLLSAQVHNNNGEWHLCHSSCGLLDAGPLSTWLAEIKTWMDANPNDVVTVLLVNSDNASAQDLSQEFEAAKISQYAYTPPSTTAAVQTWPTLQDMIANKTRLVTFVASLPPASNTAAPYLLDEFTFVFENNYNTTDASNFSCTADRPPVVQGNSATAISSGRLPLQNHFLYQAIGLGIQSPNTSYVATTNGRSGVGNLAQAVSDCSKEYQRQSTFLLVDFFDQGDAVGIVNEINGVSDSVTGQVKPAAASSGAAMRMRSPLGGWLCWALVVGIASQILVSLF